MKQKSNAFTLIELIAVLVVMAIIALIATPLVMNVIRSARVAADKRSVDAYGRSIELAIAGYLLDNGRFPTQLSELTIEYSGNEVECETTQINPDSSIYLTGCTVAGRNVENYVYGSDKSPTYTAYRVGDHVSYKNIDYYVIKDSGVKEDVVTLLKAEPLSVEDVSLYGIGHINRYTVRSVDTVYDKNGYGGIAYYSSPTCKESSPSDYSGCTTDYTQSEIKYVVDAWASAKIGLGNYYDARLIKLDEYLPLIDEEQRYDTSGSPYKVFVPKFDWIKFCNENVVCWWWTMSSYNASNTTVYNISGNYIGNYYNVVNPGYNGGADGALIRPVVELYKSALQN